LAVVGFLTKFTVIPMYRTDVVVIGAGQAGLAMSRCLSDWGIAHIVLEQGRIGERWRSGTWDSLRLLTPNWMTRLPGWRYRGADPDGFMRKDDVTSFLESYAASFAAPIAAETTVLSVSSNDSGYRVTTTRGEWHALAVVVATGECQASAVPCFAEQLSPAIHQVTADSYKRPDALPPGGVLVIGASASGLQLADEIYRSGRPVTLSVGRHTRLPRRYRGHDIMAWMDAVGVFDKRAEDVPDLEAARRQPSLQLVGRPDGRPINLSGLRDSGIRLVGRTAAMQGTSVCFAGDLAATTEAAERKLLRLLERIDGFVTANGMSQLIDAPDPPVSAVLDVGSTEIDLKASGIETVVWATGYRRSYPWLRVPVLGHNGEIEHQGGMTRSLGLYVLGLRFLRRRKSNFIDGVGQDAAALAQHIALHLRAANPLAA